MNNDTNIMGEDILMSRGCCASSRILDKSNKKMAHSCPKLDTREWLSDIPAAPGSSTFQYVEVRFKNSHKAFFKTPEEIELNKIYNETIFINLNSIRFYDIFCTKIRIQQW